MAFGCSFDLGLHSPLPDPSLLTYFRKRLGLPRQISGSSRN